MDEYTKDQEEEADKEEQHEDNQEQERDKMISRSGLKMDLSWSRAFNASRAKRE